MTLEQQRTLERRVFGGAITILFMITVFFLKREVQMDDKRYEQQKEFNQMMRDGLRDHEYRLQDLERYWPDGRIRPNKKQP